MHIHSVSAGRGAVGLSTRPKRYLRESKNIKEIIPRHTYHHCDNISWCHILLTWTSSSEAENTHAFRERVGQVNAVQGCRKYMCVVFDVISSCSHYLSYSSFRQYPTMFLCMVCVYLETSFSSPSLLSHQPGSHWAPARANESSECGRLILSDSTQGTVIAIHLTHGIDYLHIVIATVNMAHDINCITMCACPARIRADLRRLFFSFSPQLGEMGWRGRVHARKAWRSELYWIQLHAQSSHYLDCLQKICSIIVKSMPTHQRQHEASLLLFATQPQRLLDHFHSLFFRGTDTNLSTSGFGFSCTDSHLCQKYTVLVVTYQCLSKPNVLKLSKTKITEAVRPTNKTTLREDKTVRDYTFQKWLVNSRSPNARTCPARTEY